MIREVDLVSYLPPFMQSYKERSVTLPLEPEVYRDIALCLPSFAEASPASRRFIEYVKKMVAPDGSIRDI